MYALYIVITNCHESLQNGYPFFSLLSVQAALTCTGGNLANITHVDREAKNQLKIGENTCNFSFKIRQLLLQRDGNLWFYHTQTES